MAAVRMGLGGLHLVWGGGGGGGGESCGGGQGVQCVSVGWIGASLALGACLLLVFTVGGNLFVLLVVAANGKLRHKRTSLLICNLALADLLVGTPATSYTPPPSTQDHQIMGAFSSKARENPTTIILDAVKII
ncbi:MAG: hypothetical protein GY820_02485 [Gammaproteobacteria bacterium]|nr:hypothetical protein [Gammaproteobacteria bacterium]